MSEEILAVSFRIQARLFREDLVIPVLHIRVIRKIYDLGTDGMRPRKVNYTYSRDATVADTETIIKLNEEL